MDRIPFGIAQLDTIINGGAPSGSVVLLAGEAGAGAREFMYTSTVMNALAEADPELFELNYGSYPESARPPGEIHYVSFTAARPELEDEFGQVIEAEMVDPSIGEVAFEDLSGEYFGLSPVPRSWYAGTRQRINDLGQRDDRRDVLEALGDYLDENAPGNLVLIDSLSDLAALSREGMGWDGVAMLVKGLRRAARGWDGLIMLLVDKESMSETEFGMLMGSADGTFVFEWASGGNELDRTMVVQEFRGVLPEIEAENIVRFETEIGDAGFDISDIRKIR
ncbi:MAG: RAD55 family ATPase [Halobacteriales archaeon]